MWQTLESDPGLFTELVEKWGVQDIEFNELVSVDPASFEMLESDTIYGVVFLFNHTQRPVPKEEPEYNDSAPVFFANQVVENSCASQALLDLVLSHGDRLEVSDELASLREFCSAVDFQMRGEVIGGSEFLRNSHNSMCSPQSFAEESDGREPQRQTTDAFHYVAFVPAEDHIYELDGLKRAPIDHGPIKNSLISSLSEVLTKRIAEFGENQLGFSIIVATNDLRKSKAHASDSEWQSMQLEKRQRWYRENELRRYQFMPLAIELLKQLPLHTESKEVAI